METFKNWIKKIIGYFTSKEESSPARPPVITTPPDNTPLPEAQINHGSFYGLFPDISHYHKCDFKKTNVPAMITKATDGVKFVDDTLKYNMNECLARNIKFGVYHFYRVFSDPIYQAEHFINTVGLENLKNFYFPPILDFETVTNRKVGPLQNEADMKRALPDVKIFIQHIFERTGRYPMFYTYQSLLTYCDLDVSFTLCELWIARYGAAPTNFKPWSHPYIWQYSDGIVTSKGLNDNFKGMGRVDGNILWNEYLGHPKMGVM